MVLVWKDLTQLPAVFQEARELTLKQRRIIRDFAGLVLSKVVGQGAELITISLLAHRYGLEDYSILIFALSATALMRVSGNFGLDKWAIREIAVKVEKRDETVAMIFTAQLQWLASLYILYAGAVLLCLPEQKPLFLAAGLYQLLYAILLVIYGVAAGYEHFELERMTSMVVGGVLLATTVILYIKQVEIELMILPYLIAVLAGILFAISYRWQIFGFEIRWPMLYGNKLKGLLTSTINFGLTDICNNLQVFMIYLMIDRLLVEQSNVGLFNASFRVIIAVLFIFQLFMKRMYPVLAKLEGLQKSFHRSLMQILLTGLVFHGLVVLLAPFLIKTIFGPEFLPAIPLLRLGSLAAPVILSNEYFATLCAVGKREVEMKRISFIGILTLTIAGAYWIPRYHVEGAMWAFIIGELVKWVLYYLELSEHCHSEEKVMEVF